MALLPVAILSETYPRDSPASANALRQNRLLVLGANKDSALGVIRHIMEMRQERSENLTFQTFDDVMEGREAQPFFDGDSSDESKVSDKDKSSDESGAGDEAGDNESIHSDNNLSPGNNQRPLLTICTTYEGAMAFISECMALGASFGPATAAASA